MFTETHNKELIYDEFKDFQVQQSYLDDIWNNTNIKIYLYLLNNMKNKVKYDIILQEYEWKFMISKLHFCKTLLRNLKIEKSYKQILLHNFRENFKHFEI
tara:strand:- start:324 stop:623 length:300 start_codon:yes stop_codon:yes gene_type:complete